MLVIVGGCGVGDSRRPVVLVIVGGVPSLVHYVAQSCTVP